MNDIVEESGQFIKKITRLQTIVGMRSDYYADRGTVRNALELRLQPPDKYYSLQLVDEPRGDTLSGDGDQYECVVGGSSNTRAPP